MAGHEQLQAGVREHRRRDKAEAGDAGGELEADIHHERLVDEDGNLQIEKAAIPVTYLSISLKRMATYR